MSEMTISVLAGDCIDVLADAPDNSVDLIVTSPPYADARKRTYGGIAPDDYVDWFLPRAHEFYRVLAPTGSFVLNIKEKCVDGERHTYVLELIQALRSECGFRWVEEYMWHKTTAAPGYWRNRFRDAWERCLHFTKERRFKMNQDAVRVPIGDWTEARLKKLGNGDLARHDSATGSGVGRNISHWRGKDTVLPSNVLHGSPVAHNTGHSAAFPEWLPEWFIKLFTDEGDLVLDPFVGSGTTLRAAKRLGRCGIGVEILEPVAAGVAAQFGVELSAQSRLNGSADLVDSIATRQRRLLEPVAQLRKSNGRS